MPALRLFGRRWHVALDDLPPFALAGLGFHGVWTAFLAAGLALDTTQCRDSGWVHLRAYLAALLGVDAVQTFAMTGLIYIGMQGSILDVKRRSSGSTFLYLISLAYTALLGVQVYGSVMLGYMDCDTPNGWNSPSFAIAAFALHWTSIVAFVATFTVTFNMYPNQSDPASWRRQCTCYGRLCCLGESTNSWVSQSFLMGVMRRSFRSGRYDAPALVPPKQQAMGGGKGRGAMPQQAGGDPAHGHGHSYEPLAGGSGAGSGAGLLSSGGRVLQATGCDEEGGGMTGGPGEAEARLRMSGRGGLGSGGGRSMRLEQMADLFHMVLSHVDLTPSDYATGLMLVGILHRILYSSHAAAKPPTSPTRGIGSMRVADNASATAPGGRGHGAAKAKRRRGGEELPPLVLSPGAPGLEVLQDVVLYFRHACAVYGWPMHLWTSRSQPHKCCTVCTGCCACCQPRQHPLEVRKNMTIEAIRSATGMDPAKDLLHLCTANKVEGLLPYYIALERERREVIIAVRGSMSQRDMLTDFLCFPAHVDPSWANFTPPSKAAGPSPSPTSAPTPTAAPSPRGNGAHSGTVGEPGVGSRGGTVAGDGQGAADRAGEEDNARGVGSVHTKGVGGGGPLVEEILAHQGVLNCAYAVADDIHSTGVLRAVLECDEAARASLKDPVYKQDCRGWKVIVVGHSLGAGVAALLAMHLRNLYPTLNCWAFSPPGGLLSPAAAQSMTPYCTSVVLGKDMIPRLSILAMQRLTEAMVMATARCKVSKTRLWAQTVLGKKWSEQELFKPEDQLDEVARQTVMQLKQGVERSIPADGMGRALDFQPPGRLLYLEKEDQPDVAGMAMFKPRWMSPEELVGRGLIVSRRMFSMHVPDFQAKAFKQTLKRAKATQQDVAEADHLDIV